jgi:NAD(P)-dependent dehydrogenase (short-subunit alcohol dehydrogenase family)
MATFVTNHKSPYNALTTALSTRPLSGRSVLITGANRGIGVYITNAIAAAGASKIAVVGRNKAAIEAARDTYAKNYPKTTFVAYSADVTDEAAITSVFDSFGAPDILINNAGHFPDDGPFVDQDLKTWFSGFEINIFGSANVTQKFLKAKPKNKSAHVLNVSSMAAHMRFPLIGWSGYNASKMGAARIFENIRFEHPEVHFVNVHPGNIESDGFTKSGASAPPSGMTDGELAGQFFAWLATTEAEFLSGRFVWAEWDIEELKARKDDILEDDLLLTTIDGFTKGF